MALMMISVMITRSVRGSSTMARSLASTSGIPCPLWRSAAPYSSVVSRSRDNRIVETVQAVDGDFRVPADAPAGPPCYQAAINQRGADDNDRTNTVVGLDVAG